MMRCTWFVTMFAKVTHVKWDSHECQYPRFPSRTLHCNKMANVFSLGLSVVIMLWLIGVDTLMFSSQALLLVLNIFTVDLYFIH